MRTSDINRIARTINEQLNATTTWQVRGSWGISRRVATTYNGMATLALRVSGVYHKGWGYISYNEGGDLYEIRLVNTKNVLKKTVEEVYADAMGEIIDRLVERGTTDAETYARLALEDTANKLNVEII